MAQPMTQTQWRTALAAEGVKVRYAPGWTTHGRDEATGKPFGPMNGVMIHHTAGTSSLDLVIDGRSDLPGPLAHAHLAKTGSLTMISMHRANHAGTVAQNAFSAVLVESLTHPRPAASEPVDGNDHFYGIEIENRGNGSDPYPPVQLDQAVRWATAICRHHGWSEDSVIGHKEATRRKIDPSFSMTVFRAAVAQRLAHTSSWNPGDSTTEAKPVTQQQPAENEAYRNVVEADAIEAPRNHPDYAVNKYWTMESYLRFIAEELIRQRS